MSKGCSFSCGREEQGFDKLSPNGGEIVSKKFSWSCRFPNGSLDVSAECICDGMEHPGIAP